MRLRKSDLKGQRGRRLMNSGTGNWRKLYPAVASRYTTAHGFRYHYLDQTMSSSAPVVLCVHGNPTWSFFYRAVVNRFTATHRIVAVDHLGCGLSEKPPRNRFTYSLANHRDNLIQLVDELDLRNVTLLAHDWGGAIGLATAIARVDRMSGIVLMNTAAFPPPYVPWRIGVLRTPWLGPAAIRGLNAFAAPALRMAMDRQQLDRVVADGLIYPYRSWADRVGVDGFVRDIPLTRRHPTFAVLEQLEQDLCRLNHLPRKLIWGMKDWCFREECLDRFRQHWPDASVTKLANVGHYVIEDDPEATLNEIAEFLYREQA